MTPFDLHSQNISRADTRDVASNRNNALDDAPASNAGSLIKMVCVSNRNGRSWKSASELSGSVK
jgi:hypothetical protein